MTLAAAIVDEVRRRLTARRMSQRELARAAGIPASLLHRTMSGERQLRVDELERIAAAFGVTAEYLVRLASRSTSLPPTGDSSETNSALRQD